MIVFFTDPAVFHTIFKKLERFLFGIFLQEKNVQAKLLQQQSIFPILKILNINIKKPQFARSNSYLFTQ